jgi:hypothetical protein
MLPYSLGNSFISALSGIVVARTGDYRLVIWGAWAIFTLGFGLMIKLDDASNTCAILASSCGVLGC